MQSQQFSRYTVVPAGARYGADRVALIDSVTRRIVRVYHSRQLAVSDAAFLNRRTPPVTNGVETHVARPRARARVPVGSEP